MKRTLVTTAALLVGLVAINHDAMAQRRTRNAAPPGPPPPAEQAAPIDLTGYWVSVVTEDWRWRMLTPPKGDYTSVPLNAAGIKVADQFNPALYGGANYQWSQIIDCRAYGMAGLMRMPTDLHVTWATPNVLRIETDWGEQTRNLYFRRSDMPQGGPMPQGRSFASWERPIPLAIGASHNPIDLNGNPIPPRAGQQARRGARGGAAAPPMGGDLKVVTDDLTPGWLRRNGVPYGAKTGVTEYYQTYTDPLGRKWFDVFTIVSDPEYLQAPFVTSSDYRRLSDGSSWSPHPCKTVQGSGEG